MGARSSPEGYRVAVGRYGLPVQTRAQLLRRLRVAGLMVVAVSAAGCSHVTGSKSTKDGKPLPCTFITELDQIANTVATADVRNPDTFQKTLDAAVRDYVANVHDLRAIAPQDLRAGLTRVEADVQQYRFDAARTDRVALDAYAARSCGRVTHSASTVPGTGTTAPNPTTSGPLTATTVTADATPTTAPSDG
jgi:hypothetical protein